MFVLLSLYLSLVFIPSVPDKYKIQEPKLTVKESYTIEQYKQNNGVVMQEEVTILRKATLFGHGIYSRE